MVGLAGNRLVGEAEALELLEVGARRSGTTLYIARPVTGLSQLLVTLKKARAGLADSHVLRGLLGREGPRQLADVGVEARSAACGPAPLSERRRRRGAPCRRSPVTWQKACVERHRRRTPPRPSAKKPPAQMRATLAVPLAWSVGRA